MTDIPLNISLGTIHDLARNLEGAPDLVEVTSTSKRLNRGGQSHHELTGDFVRQVSVTEIPPMVRNLVLTKISDYLVTHAPQGDWSIEVRVPPEARFHGHGDAIVKWYVRLSVCEFAASSPVPA